MKYLYSTVVRGIITVLENHLLEEWKLADYAKKVGYSKYYLTRQFKKETGMTIGEYVRTRRLAIAAFLLLHSNMSILEISFELQFQSQEAFTRAFKELYEIPPGKYRKHMQTLVKVEGGNMVNMDKVKGWVITGSNPELFEMNVDHSIFHAGKSSGHFSSKGAVEGQFGAMMQVFSAEKWRGKRMRISCFIKTNNVSKCGAWCNIDNYVGDTIQFDNMDNRPIKGTTDWNYYTIVLDVPVESASIQFGILLVGSGDVWVDCFKLEEVDSSVPSTNMLDQPENLPLEPINLGFDE